MLMAICVLILDIWSFAVQSLGFNFLQIWPELALYFDSFSIKSLNKLIPSSIKPKTYQFSN